MTKISAIILTNNRDDVIEGCLKSLNWVDENIVLNLGITDNTEKIAKKYHCRILLGSKEFNFAAWRNEAAKYATGQWLLYIDADERITKSLQKETLNTINSSKSSYYIPRKNYFLGKEFKSTWPDYQLRLIKKDNLIKWQGKIHEIPKVKGAIGYLKNPLIHLSHRNLETSLTNTLNWSKLEAENRFLNNHPQMSGWRFVNILIRSFWEQFIKLKVWRDGTEGVIDGLYQMFSLFISYVRLWELQRKEFLSETYKKLDQKLIKDEL